MAAVTRLTHKIAIQLNLLAKSCTFAVLAPGGQSGNLWIHPRTFHVLKSKFNRFALQVSAVPWGHVQQSQASDYHYCLTFARSRIQVSIQKHVTLS